MNNIKQEIKHRYLYKSPLLSLQDAVEGSMDEWAKVMSIRFVEWVLYEGYSLSAHKPLPFTWEKFGDNLKYSTEYLYNLFLESIKEQQ